MPHFKGTFRTGTAILLVAHYTAQQADVRVTDGVVHVEIHLELRRNVNFVLLVLGHRVTKRVVERMYPLYYYGRFGRNLCRDAVFGATVAKLVNGQFHLLACDKRGHLLVEQLYVKGIDVLEVLHAVFVVGDIFAVFVVHVQRDTQRRNSTRHKLDTQAITEGRLSTAAGTCNANKFDVFDV